MLKLIAKVVAVIAVLGIGIGVGVTINHVNNSEHTEKKASSSHSTSKSNASSTTSVTSSSKAVPTSNASSSSVASVSSVSTSMTQSEQFSEAAKYDPNQTASGTDITDDDIAKAREKMIAAGLPADNFAPSDIKDLIRQSSETGRDVVDLAKENFHQ
ncbi:hypothetical protein K1728_04430 [Weissella confusa]|uniref:hypothetical protein n=1 Tax=Weissella confusa TaxID=1583 RepID=UPI001C6FC033|nr:hypothetical protein [Weissella confusa]QYU58651.1 hypothetical protein K1728_04430 [Weissella confusa]